MRLKIKKHYHRDLYTFYIPITSHIMDVMVRMNYKIYKAKISTDFKRIEFVDKPIISGIMGERQKELSHLTIYKGDIISLKNYINS